MLIPHLVFVQELQNNNLLFYRLATSSRKTAVVDKQPGKSESTQERELHVTEGLNLVCPAFDIGRQSL